MFSATFQPKIEKLASFALNSPVKVLCGEVGAANSDVVQIVRILPDLETKFNWLFHHLVEFCTRKF
jgi:superfamily II DNA/RNA helicase